MHELFYDFCFGGENRGYYHLQQTDTVLYSETKFHQPNGELYVNTFTLQLEGDKVLAYQYRDEAWVDFRAQPKHIYPTSAYPLLLPKALNDPYVYTAFSEHDGSVLGETVLTKKGQDITEVRQGNTVRRFTMRGGTPIYIDWGGPISYLCKTKEEAVKGTKLGLSDG